MARPPKTTVPYFSHDADGDATIDIIKSKFRAVGYAFWYCLQELLGRTPDHCYDCSKPLKWWYLLTVTMVDENMANEIIDTLVELEELDKELWGNHKIIWVQSFVDKLKPVYDTRTTELPTKPTVSKQKTPETDSFLRENPPETEVSTRKTPQSKVKDSRVNKPEQSHLPETGGVELTSRDLLTHFGKRFEEYVGEEYHATFGKDNKLLKGLSDHYGSGPVQEGIDYFFQVYVHTDDFSAKNPTVGIFHMKWNSIVAHSRGKAAKQGARRHKAPEDRSKYDDL